MARVRLAAAEPKNSSLSSNDHRTTDSRGQISPTQERARLRRDYNKDRVLDPDSALEASEGTRTGRDASGSSPVCLACAIRGMCEWLSFSEIGICCSRDTIKAARRHFRIDRRNGRQYRTYQFQLPRIEKEVIEECPSDEK